MVTVAGWSQKQREMAFLSQIQFWNSLYRFRAVIWFGESQNFCFPENKRKFGPRERLFAFHIIPLFVFFIFLSF